MTRERRFTSDALRTAQPAGGADPDRVALHRRYRAWTSADAASPGMVHLELVESLTTFITWIPAVQQSIVQAIAIDELLQSAVMGDVPWRA